MQEPVIHTVGIVVFKEGSVLLVRHNETSANTTGYYGLPGGVRQIGETAQETCVRKLLDETGLSTQFDYLMPLPASYEAEMDRKDGRKMFSIQPYICVEYTGNIHASRDQDPEWVCIEDLDAYNLLPNTPAIIHDGVSFMKGHRSLR